MKFSSVVVAIISVCSYLDMGYAQGPGALPFSNVYRRPSTSRYQNMANFANNPLASSNIYQSMVQPNQDLDRTRIEQMTQSLRLGSAQEEIRRLQQPSNTMIDQSIRPTGHSATFMNYSHFFPSAR